MTHAILKYKKISDNKQLRSFLGLTLYYLKCIPFFSKVATPLFALIRKDVLFQWNEQCQSSFAVLSQQQENGLIALIAYASRTLQKHDQSYEITELEALGVVWAIRHFRPYIRISMLVKCTLIVRL